MQTPHEVGQIWTSIYNVNLGTVLAWIIVLGTLTVLIIKGIKKILELLKEYQQRKEEYTQLQAMVLSHEEQMTKLEDVYNRIDRHFKETQELSLANLRHTIVRAGEEAIMKGEITIRELSSLDELNQVYTNTFKQNSYVHTLVDKVHLLPVIGNLDEHGNDI